MDSLLKDFRKIEKEEIFLSSEENDKKEFENLKSKINFKKRIEEIKNIWESNEFFSKISIDSIIENGRKNIESCKNVIISLSGLKGILPSVDKDIPLITILQAFFVKEIELGYGLNINSLNIAIKLLKKNFENIFNNKKNIILENNFEDNNILNLNKLYQNIDGISKKINDILEKSNKKLINQLAKFLYYLADIIKKYQMEDIDNFNIEFINIIEDYCTMFFEKEIIESEKLSFMWNYLSKLKLILEDIEDYSKKEVWDNFEMEIKN